MDYYPALRKKEILPFAATCVDPEGIMLSAICHTEKDKYCVISLICGIQKATPAERENRLVATAGEGEGWEKMGEGGWLKVTDLKKRVCFFGVWVLLLYTV